MQSVLLLHGLTATPVQMIPQKEALLDAGFTVESPMLPGHGTTENDLSNTTWEEWYNCAVESLYKLHNRTNSPVNLVGLSMGAVLVLKLLEDHPQICARAVCIGTALHLPKWVTFLLPIMNLPVLRSKKSWPKGFDSSVADPAGREVYRESSYPNFPVESVRQLQSLQRATQSRLNLINSPLLLIHSKRDTAAPPSCAKDIQSKVASVSSIIWLSQSLHVATLDYDRELINKALVDFFTST